MDDRVVLVTGASSGLGEAIAGHLHHRGFRVFGTSRTPQATSSGAYAMVELDVTSDVSVERCVTNVLSEAGRIDVLVNNAGYGLEGFAEETTLEQARAQFETNFFGLVRTTRAVLPLMRKAGGGHLVQMGSLSGLIGVPGEAFYSAAKHAIEGYSEALQHELHGFGIHVSIVEPGFFRTDFHSSIQVASDRIADYDGNRQQLLASFEDGLANGGNPRTVAETVLRAIQARQPRLRYPAGRGAVWLPRLRRIVPASFFDRKIRQQFRLEPHVRGGDARESANPTSNTSSTTGAKSL